MIPKTTQRELRERERESGEGGSGMWGKPSYQNVHGFYTHAHIHAPFLENNDDIPPLACMDTLK